MAKCSGLGCHRYDEIERSVIRAGDILAITGFLSDKMTKEELNLFNLGSLFTLAEERMPL